jgi:hypothetical protein
MSGRVFPQSDTVGLIVFIKFVSDGDQNIVRKNRLLQRPVRVPELPLLGLLLFLTLLAHSRWDV